MSIYHATKIKGTCTHILQAGQVSTHAERNRRKLWPYNEGQWSLGVEKLSQSSHARDKGAGAKIMSFLFVFYRNHLFFIQPKVLYSGACMLLVFVHNAVHYRENEGPRPPSSCPSAPEDVCPWALSLAWACVPNSHSLPLFYFLLSRYCPLSPLSELYKTQ